MGCDNGWKVVLLVEITSSPVAVVILYVVGIYTSIKNLNEGDIGMANYEKQVEQEAAYPIPISLYNCYRTRNAI